MGFITKYNGHNLYLEKIKSACHNASCKLLYNNSIDWKDTLLIILYPKEASFQYLPYNMCSVTFCWMDGWKLFYSIKSHLSFSAPPSGFVWLSLKMSYENLLYVINVILPHLNVD